MKSYQLTVLCILFFSLTASSQTNLVTNGGFETYTNCPNFGGQWNYCTGWNNVNGTTGVGFFGSPDYYNFCGSSGYAPPSMNGGTCTPHQGNGMMGLVFYNVPYPDYREYIARPLNSPMTPGTTYTVSFWITNGTGIKSPWTIRNIGICFSSGPLTQTGYGVISAIPQCEITSNVATNAWVKYTFTVNPTTTWNHMTFGAFRTDANNNPTLFFPNPGGNYSVYSHYFVDDFEVISCAQVSVSTTAQSFTICEGSATTVSVSGASSYTWLPGNSSSTTSVLSPTATTIYTVMGAVGSCTGSAVIVASVIPVPTVAVTAPTNSLCQGQTVTLLANGANNYSWSTGQTGSTILVSPGTNTVYTVTGEDGNCKGSSVFNITVNPVPVLALNGSTTFICAGQSASLFATGAANYTWNTGQQGASITVSPQVTTTYSLTGSIGSCNAISEITIQVNPLPVMLVTSSTDSICSGGSASLSATGAASYSWSNGQQIPAIVVSPITTTTYTVIGNTGACIASSSLTIVVNPTPTLLVTASTLSICAGQSTSLSVSGANTYTWNTGHQSTGLVVSPPATTTYTVKGTQGSCIANTTHSVNVNPSPILSLSSSTAFICTGQTSVLYGSGAKTYTWSTGHQAVAIFVSPSVTTMYTVTGSIGSCTASAPIGVTVNPLPQVTINGPPSFICIGKNAVLSASGAINYTWNTGQQGTGINVSPNVTTSFSVNGVDMNGCLGQALFTVSVTICEGIGVLENRITPLSYPNPFNDILIIETPGAFAWDRINVVNIAGEQVYSTEGQANVFNQANVTRLQLGHLPKGIYFLQFHHGGEVFTAKVVKE